MTKAKPPREFWISDPSKAYDEVYSEKPEKVEPYHIHVIEHSAFQNLKKDADRLAKELEKLFDYFGADCGLGTGKALDYYKKKWGG